MDDAKRDLVRAWLLRASHDLASARKLATGADPLLDTAIFHCQQAAEKTLKAFLVCSDQRVPKTHDLTVLLKLAAVIEPRIGSALSDPDRLTEYGSAILAMPSSPNERSTIAPSPTRKASIVSCWVCSPSQFTRPDLRLPSRLGAGAGGALSQGN